jgi:hypothetical protein
LLGHRSSDRLGLRQQLYAVLDMEGPKPYRGLPAAGV